ncbi:MAG TPA: ATP-binding cassette domain-containing protein, partial [Spirochaetia bacterium]|nr:ATP-binding cassette domain-containing protein [Spirochaetia bacterium]
MTISVSSLSVSFQKRPALRDVSLEVPSARIVGLLGPSGAGKTTLIRCIAGLLIPHAGLVRIDSRRIPDRGISRSVG